MNYLRKCEETFKLISDMLKTHEIKPGAEPIFREIIYNLSIMRTKLMTWIDYGEKTFVLTKDLIDAFTHTDIPWDLTPENFNYPFEAFMIEGHEALFQTNFTDQKELSKKYTPRNVNGILYISTNLLLKDPNIRWVGFNGEEATKPNWDISLTGLFTNPEGNLENLMMHMKKNETIEVSATTRKPGLMLLPLETEDTKNLANIFFNTVLYINDPSRIRTETEEHKIRTVKDIATGKFREQKYIVLKAPKTYVSLTHSGRKLDKRFIVRGHWWPRLSNTESQKPRRWVFPFWKGPSLGEVANKPYLLTQ